LNKTTYNKELIIIIIIIIIIIMALLKMLFRLTFVICEHVNEYFSVIYIYIYIYTHTHTYIHISLIRRIHFFKRTNKFAWNYKYNFII